MNDMPTIVEADLTSADPLLGQLTCATSVKLVQNGLSSIEPDYSVDVRAHRYPAPSGNTSRDTVHKTVADSDC